MTPPDRSGGKRQGLAHKAFIIILIAYCVYAGLFIIRTSFVLDGERYFSLFDDAMISMRYAKNLAEGHGLVWNPGERVEGYTNPLWTIYMAGIHLLPVSPSKTSLLVQVSSLIILAANLLALRKLADLISGGNRFVAAAALLLTAFYLPLNSWAIQGMEVGVLAFLVTLAVLYAIRMIEEGRFSVKPYLILGCSTFIRIDMSVVFAALLLFLLWAMPRGRRKHVLTGVVILGVVLVAQTAFRMWYYGEALPNTYYLKLAGYPFLLRVFRGFYVAAKLVGGASWVFFLLPLIVILLRRDVKMMLLGWLFVAQVLYSIYVGGDAWETWGGSNRYICVVMPVFFLLLAESLRQVGSYLGIGTADRSRIERLPAFVGRHPQRVGGVIIVLALLSFNSIQGPIALTEWLLLSRPFHVDRNEKMVERALLLREITTSDARLGIVWDGAIGYFSERHCISMLGKNDYKIAREPMRTYPLPGGLVAFLPGHMKWDYGYSIGELKPDIVVQFWMNQEEAAKYLQASYVRAKVGEFTLDFLEDSPNVRWDRVRAMIRETG
jgi:hypothetical protein